MRVINLTIRLTISLILLAISGLAQAATITVGPGAGYDFDRIQAGIDDANDDDTVLVAPGEYVITEPITFRGKAITVISEAGPDETTIRMGTPADTNRGSVVVFENNETAASVLDGFTITGGQGSWRWFAGLSMFGWGGGGILFAGSTGTVRNCAIVDNTSREAGGGVVCTEDNASVTMTNCTIAANLAGRVGSNAPTHVGGGVLVMDGCSVTLTNCNITENSSGHAGGGLYCWQNSSAIVTDCTIVKNRTHLSGGALMCYKSLATLTNCVIAGNYSTHWGGGVSCEFQDASATVTNCIISGNSAGNEGGGLFCYLISSLTLNNCTIWGNSAGQWGGGVGCFDGPSVPVTNSIISGNTAPMGREVSVRNPTTTLTVAYSAIAGGEAGVYVQGGSTLNWGAGNIDADPCFGDPNQDDFHLKSQAGRWDPTSQIWVKDDVTSPCIDAGDPNSDWSGETWPHGQRINIGAYGGTAEASMSAEAEGISLPRVLYVYDDDDMTVTNSFESLLEMYGISVAAIPVNNLEQVSLADYDLVIVADDTSGPYTFDDGQFVAAVEESGKPVVGLGDGGYDFFGELGLWIGNPYGGHGSKTGIYVVDPEYSLFSTPYPIDIPDDRILQLYTETNHVGIYLWPDVPESVFVIGTEPDDVGYYPLVTEHDRYLLWGFIEPPEKMTEVGKRLFINVVIWFELSMAARADLNDDDHVDLRDFSELARYWMQDEASVDIYPPSGGDGVIDAWDVMTLCEYWLREIPLH